MQTKFDVRQKDATLKIQHLEIAKQKRLININGKKFILKYFIIILSNKMQE